MCDGIERLRSRYLGKMGEYASELMAIAARRAAADREGSVREDTDADADLARLRTLFHQLAGNGKMYGFDAVSRAAERAREAGRTDPVGAARALAARLEALVAGGPGPVEPPSDTWLKEAGSSLPPGDERPPKADRPPLVLLVDDDPDSAHLVTLALARHEVYALRAGSWPVARRALAGPGFDLVLLKPALAGADPAAALAAVRAAAADATGGAPPVLALADDRDPGRVAALLSAGAADVLGRPFAPSELRARIRAALRREASRRTP